MRVNKQHDYSTMDGLGTTVFEDRNHFIHHLLYV